MINEIKYTALIIIMVFVAIKLIDSSYVLYINDIKMEFNGIQWFTMLLYSMLYTYYRVLGQLPRRTTPPGTTPT